ncbi:solute carrier DMT family [Gracilaria domingensis]|nr:solute carrier DMT family [Gracilaria domingensis]
MCPRLRVALLIIFWFSSSSLAVLVTKALFSGIGHHVPPFPFALTLTATNNVVASLASYSFSSRTQHISRDEGATRVAFIIGAATAVEIGLSNIALTLLTVSFSTVLKGIAPFFVLGWGVVLRIHTLRFSIAASLFAMAVGLILAVTGEHNKASPALSHLLRVGFLAQLLSGLFSGFRWVLTQIFIKGEAVLDERATGLLRHRSNSTGWSAIETVRQVSPFTLMWVLPFVFIMEGLKLFSWLRDASFQESSKLFVVLWIIGGSVFLLLWCEYELVRITSSLTVSVTFVLKEVLVIFAGALIFRDRLSWLTCVGFIIVQGGVLAYASESNRESGKQTTAKEQILDHEIP